MILTVLLTFWITCGLIYTLKQCARPFHNDGLIILLDFIFSPYLLYSDIAYEWKDCKELRKKYKPKK